ncbi:MAG: PIN domain-containing protein [Treponema sp.]|nr:PIN domain-containing protein [Treponema sp.]
MILFDTNVLIDFWKNPKELLKLDITPDKFSICGPVRTELLHGAKDNEVNDILALFKGFNNIVMDDYDWEGAGFILQTMRSNGFQIPFADAVIAFIAMKYDIPLWTQDTHFLLIQGCYPELKLYSPKESF